MASRQGQGREGRGTLKPTRSLQTRPLRQPPVSCISHRTRPLPLHACNTGTVTKHENRVARGRLRPRATLFSNLPFSKNSVSWFAPSAPPGSINSHPTSTISSSPGENYRVAWASAERPARNTRSQHWGVCSVVSGSKYTFAAARSTGRSMCRPRRTPRQQN